MLHPISTKALTNLQFAEMMSRTKTKLDLLGGPEFYVHFDLNRARSQWLASLNPYSSSLEKPTKSIMTEDTDEDDNDRDGHWISIVEVVAGHRKSKNAQRRKAAELIGILLDRNKGLHRKERNAQTSGTEIVLEELAQPIYSAAISLLGLAPLINDLKEASDRFRNNHLRRSLSTMGTVVGVTRSAREVLDARYRRMCKLIEILLGLAEEEGLQDEFAGKVLEIINLVRKDFADIIAIKEGRKEAARLKQVAAILAQAEAEDLESEEAAKN